jgi:hypothetical protein
VGIHLAVPLTLLGDQRSMPWYPFTKNASARESIFYLHDSLAISPLELLLLATATGWLLGRFDHREPIQFGTLIRPVAVFGAFATAGFLLGVARGGDPVIALFQFRPFLYLVLVYVLASDLFHDLRQYRRLMGWIVVALAAESIHALVGWWTRSPFEREIEARQSLLEHSAFLHHNTLYVLLAASFVFSQASTRLRWWLSVALVPITAVYLLSERRAAFVGLLLAMGIVAAVLRRERPAAFRILLPLATIAFAIYLPLFWNQDSPVALPALAIKSVIAPDQLGEVDGSSNEYREIENRNLQATIDASPLTGRGMGQRFIQIEPLMGIEVFELWEYVPHNSILWFWTATGVGGVIALFYLVGSVTITGLRAVRHQAGLSDTDRAVTLAATTLWPLFLLFAWVDMAWGAQTMVYLGAAAALVGSIERLGSTSALVPATSASRRIPAARHE